MQITILYASLLAILFVILSIRTIRLRRRLKIGLGDVGNSQLFRAMRTHSNFSEYVPFSLILIFLVESKIAHPLFIHALGCALFAGRILHSYGVSQNKENFKFRVSGMILTFSVILSCAAYLLFTYFI